MKLTLSIALGLAISLAYTARADEAKPTPDSNLSGAAKEMSAANTSDTMTVVPIAVWFPVRPGKLVANIPDDPAEYKLCDSWFTSALNGVVGENPGFSTEMVGVLQINSKAMIDKYEGIGECRMTSFTDSLGNSLLGDVDGDIDSFTADQGIQTDSTACGGTFKISGNLSPAQDAKYVVAIASQSNTPRRSRLSSCKTGTLTTRDSITIFGSRSKNIGKNLRARRSEMQFVIY